jgi:hypothetical protein
MGFGGTSFAREDAAAEPLPVCDSRLLLARVMAL